MRTRERVIEILKSTNYPDEAITAVAHMVAVTLENPKLKLGRDQAIGFIRTNDLGFTPYLKEVLEDARQYLTKDHFDMMAEITKGLPVMKVDASDSIVRTTAPEPDPTKDQPLDLSQVPPDILTELRSFDMTSPEGRAREEIIQLRKELAERDAASFGINAEKVTVQSMAPPISDPEFDIVRALRNVGPILDAMAPLVSIGTGMKNSRHSMHDKVKVKKGFLVNLARAAKGLRVLPRDEWK